MQYDVVFVDWFLTHHPWNKS